MPRNTFEYKTHQNFTYLGREYLPSDDYIFIHDNAIIPDNAQKTSIRDLALRNGIRVYSFKGKIVYLRSDVKALSHLISFYIETSNYT